MDTCIPAIIVEWDGVKAVVRPIVKFIYKDGSSIPSPEIHDVPVITPATAYAGIKLPVAVGDKVMLHICDRDIQDLLFNQSTAGLGDVVSKPPTKRTNNITDAIAYTGFQSLDDIIPSDEDVWIFNNKDTTNYNHIRLKSDGSIETVTTGVKITQTSSGTITIDADTSISINTPSLSVDGDVSVTGDVVASGISLAGHVHGGVESGGSITNPPS